MRRIPAGHRYWRKYVSNIDNPRLDMDYKSHTNCEDYKDQPIYETIRDKP